MILEFEELNERDPFAGLQDGSLDMVIPKRPIKKKLKGCLLLQM